MAAKWGEVCTWHLGVPTPSKGVLEWREDPRGLGVVLLPPGMNKSRFPPVFFVQPPPCPFPPLVPWSLLREQLVLADPHSPPSPCNISARKVALVCCQMDHCLLCHCWPHGQFPRSAVSSKVQSAHFQLHRWVHLGVLVCRAEVLFSPSYGCLISCKSKGREKRNDSHHHDASQIFF